MGCRQWTDRSAAAGAAAYRPWRSPLERVAGRGCWASCRRCRRAPLGCREAIAPEAVSRRRWRRPPRPCAAPAHGPRADPFRRRRRRRLLREPGEGSAHAAISRALRGRFPRRNARTWRRPTPCGRGASGSRSCRGHRGCRGPAADATRGSCRGAWPAGTLEWPHTTNGSRWRHPLSGPHPPARCGHDHEDFLAVEPRYGGDAALVRLVQAAHSRGMRVLLDFVPNHTGRGHHLFRDAIEHDTDAAGYYRFWQWPHYYRCFGDFITLPELDTGDSRVQQHLVRAAQHWLTAYGVDGIRCDHVAGVDPAFWVELRRGLRDVRPEPLVLGEATGVPDWLARYAGRLDAIFDFDLTYYVRQALARGRMSADAFAGWLDAHEHAYPGLALATLMDNHDMNRFLWMAGGNTDRLKLAATLLLTLPGMPVIYYGTEVGVSQRQDGAIENAEARLPMLWGGDQDEDLLAHFQRLGRMRRESPALRPGVRRTVFADREVFAYERVMGDESVLIALNFSEQSQRHELPDVGIALELGPLGSLVTEPSTIRS